MHEWALAEAVLYSVKKRKRRKRIEIKLRVGEMQQIDLKILRFALKELAKLEKIELRVRIRIEKTLVKCRVCGYEFGVSSFLKKLKITKREAIHFIPELFSAFIKCPKCGRQDLEIKGGRGVWIEEVR